MIFARLSRSLFGGSTSATSDVLAADVSRIVDLYRRNGYRDARVRVTASTEQAALDSAALTAALVSADRGKGLYVLVLAILVVVGVLAYAVLA